jgi:uncharacterized membrane protein
MANTLTMLDVAISLVGVLIAALLSWWGFWRA